MRTLANIIWHIPFCGFMSALAAFLGGLLLTITVVAAPIGLGLIQYSKFLMRPFSTRMVRKRDAAVKENPIWKTYSVLIWILYLPLGVVLTVVNICQIVGLCCSIVGIPMAIVLAKSISTCWDPTNKVAVSEYV